MRRPPLPASRRFRLGGLLVLLSLIPAPAAPHPHAWIDISTEIRFDSDGRISALRQHWLFDEFYTADTVQKGEQGKMDRLTARIIRNLKDYGYFTRVHAGDRPVALRAPAEVAARMEANRLKMSFTVALAEPSSPPLHYAVFDPTYFIEMLHEAKADAIRLTEAPAGCRAMLTPARPDPKAVALAAALDRTGSGGDGLGAHFAERVDITCAP